MDDRAGLDHSSSRRTSSPTISRKRAERCYRYELGIPTSSFIQFGYWDSLQKGLLAGDRLALDLKRMERRTSRTTVASTRSPGTSRSCSTIRRRSSALRDTGACTLELPEELFDADYPGHYFRRIKNVSLTLPCVAGPYTTINCTLTLLRAASERCDGDEQLP